MKRPSPRDNARHEAAHALVAWLCGIPLTSCEIRSRPVTAEEKRFVTLGFTRVTEEEERKVNDLLRSRAELTGEEHAYLTRHLLFAVAGFVSEQQAGTTSQETTGADRRSALLTAGRLSGGYIVGDGLAARVQVPEGQAPGAFRVLSDAEEQVRKLLSEHEQAWDGLASLLLHHGSLTGEQVAQYLSSRRGSG